MNVILNCEECGKQIEKSKHEYLRKIKNNSHFFCNESCGAKFQMRKVSEKKIYEYNNNPKLCKCCGSTIPYDKRHVNIYCSQSCAAKINNLKSKKIKEKTCLFCRNNYTGRGVRKFCSFKCSSEYIKNKKEKEILSGNCSNLRQYRKYLIKIRGEKCELCLWDKKNPVTNQVPLDLHHIDGNHKNNNLNNLQLLCPNCHSLTPNYKNLNKGKGREERRKIYQAGIQNI